MITEKKLNELLHEVVAVEIIKDPRPTLEILKVLHKDRPLLVLALDTAIAGYKKPKEPSDNLAPDTKKSPSRSLCMDIECMDDKPHYEH